nr:hypothetical protein [uncultured Noviherbaspirillum sp.]
MALYWPAGRGYGDSADAPELGSYDSNHLLDSILDELHLPDDAALCEALDVDESVISDLRELRREVDAALLIRMHELTDISIAGLRNILGDRRRKSRFAAEENQPHPADDEVKRDTQQHDAKPVRPREIDREEIDHQQPADPDPDDPVSP